MPNPNAELLTHLEIMQDLTLDASIAIRTLRRLTAATPGSSEARIIVFPAPRPISPSPGVCDNVWAWPGADIRGVDDAAGFIATVLRRIAADLDALPGRDGRSHPA